MNDEKDSCAICRKDVGWHSGYGSARTLYCTQCRKSEYVCNGCKDAKCPGCGTVLVESYEAFPFNVIGMLNRSKAELSADSFHFHLSRADQPIHEVRIDGHSLLEKAAYAGFDEACRILIEEFRQDPQERLSGGDTILHVMIRNRDADWSNKAAMYFMANVNARNDLGKTPLMYAVSGAGLIGRKGGHLGIVKLLLRNGADPLLESAEGKTALMIAIEENSKSTVGPNDDIIDLLKEAMLTQQALNYFRDKVRHKFEQSGKMICEERDPIVSSAPPESSLQEIPAAEKKGRSKGRSNAAHEDAMVSTIRANIEQVYGLPPGSVALCGPDGGAIKGNARIRTLRKRWDG